MRSKIRILAASVLLAMAISSAPAQTAVAAKPTPARAIAVEWRREVWLPPEVRTMDETGGNKLTVATDLIRTLGRPRWSPDGLRLGGYQKSTGTWWWDKAIMTVRADGTDERVVLTGREFDAYNVARGLKSGYEKGYGLPFGVSAWSPDGNFLLFSGLVRYEGPTTADGDDRYQSRLFTVTLDGTKTISPVTDGDASHDDFDPHWSATGKIVFVRSETTPCTCIEGLPDRTGQAQLWVVNPDGTSLQQITNFITSSLPSGTGSQLAAPVWSHAGTRIAVVGGHEGDFTFSSSAGDLWLVDYDPAVPATSATVVRGDQAVAEWHPAWSPDDAKLIYLRWFQENSRTRRFQIAIVTLATGSERVIVDQNKQAVLAPDWNPVVPVPVP